jgi:hypothetical protein
MYKNEKLTNIAWIILGIIQIIISFIYKKYSVWAIIGISNILFSFSYIEALNEIKSHKIELVEYFEDKIMKIAFMFLINILVGCFIGCVISLFEVLNRSLILNNQKFLNVESTDFENNTSDNFFADTSLNEYMPNNNEKADFAYIGKIITIVLISIVTLSMLYKWNNIAKNEFDTQNMDYSEYNNPYITYNNTALIHNDAVHSFTLMANNSFSIPIRFDISFYFKLIIFFIIFITSVFIVYKWHNETKKYKELTKKYFGNTEETDDEII